MLNRIGTYLIALSFIIFAMYLLVNFVERWMHLDIPIEIKISVILFLSGILLFLVQFLFDTLFKKDKYEEIEK